MRTIIAGSRTVLDYRHVVDAMEAARILDGLNPTVVLSGTAHGADRLGERWAREHNIFIERYSADWTLHGRGAGVMRNAQMADRAQALVALWHNKSRGTKHMIDTAVRRGLLVVVWPL